MSDNNYNLFFELRNRNIQNHKIIELLAGATKTEKNIANIKRYDQNLLKFSCVLENDNLFKFLSENFHNEFKYDFLSCIQMIYPNKNPEILKTSFTYLPKLNEQQIENLYSMFSQNCYRQENIEIVQNWLSINLEEPQKIKFVELLFKNNNKPFLNYICSINSWKDIIKSSDTSTVDPIYLNRLLSTEIKKEKINIETSLSILTEPTHTSEPSLTVKRKKRIKT